MTKLLSVLVACTFVAGLSFAGIASAQETMKKDMTHGGTMSKDTMKTDSMKMGKTKTTCMHKAGMEKNAMKKAEMMKACDAMK